MPKRGRAEESDEDARKPRESPITAKRARLQTDNSDSEDHECNSDPLTFESLSSQVHFSDKADLHAPPSQEEFEDLEKAFLPIVEAKRKAREGRVGAVADVGIIERIELVQFMCHTYLTVDFGSQLNFVIGTNGSGKSAILAGIAVGLGGKASKTERGSSVASFIQEGKSKAEITIFLKNEGDSAYMPEHFGEKIIVVRTLTRKGMSSYKLKSAKGKVLSTRKSDLDLICDYLDIRVDNPISILTQEKSKKFLKDSSPELLYEHFMQGTYLGHLKSQYAEAHSSTITMQRILESKQADLPDLVNQYNLAYKAYKDSMEAQDLRSRQRRLVKEKAWARVVIKEKELEKTFMAVAASESRLRQIEVEIQTVKASHDEVVERIKTQTDVHTELKKAAKKIWDQRDEVKEILVEKKNQLNRFKIDEDGIRQHLAEIENELSHIESQVLLESQDLEDDVQASREAIRTQLDASRARIDDLKTRRASLQTDSLQKREAANQTSSHCAALALQIEALTVEERDLLQSYQAFKSQIRDPLTQFGNNIRQVLREIPNERWFGRVPLGPLGMHVSLQNADYAEVMRQLFGGLLTAFAVTDGRDIGTLKKILVKTRNPRAQIIVSTGELFDYSEGEPDAKYITARRLLKITDEWVERILVDYGKIERTFMAPMRKEAEDLLKEVGGGVAGAAEGFKLTRWKIDGGNKSEALRDLTPKDFRYSLFRWQAEEDEEKNLREMAAKGQKLQSDIADLKTLHVQAGEYAQSINQVLLDLKASAMAVDHEIREEEIALNLKLQEDQIDSPVQLVVLEKMKNDKLSNRGSSQDQLNHVCEQKREIQPQIMALQVRVDALKKEAQALEERMKGIEGVLEEEAVAKARVVSEKVHYEGKKAEERVHLNTLQTAADAAQKEFSDSREAANQLGESAGIVRPVEVIENELSELTRTITRYDARQPKSIEELKNELETAKTKVHKFHSNWCQLNQLANALMDALRKRYSRWYEFLARSAIACKNDFMIRLSLRGYFGQVVFDHDEEKLELKIQTDDQAYKKLESTPKKKTTPASLSGGERSLSTLCFLLAVWDVCGVYIRCLDEFDVGMDNQNRRLSISMLVDAAKSAMGRQTIVITPLSIDNIFSEPPMVVIKRLADPRP